MYGLEKEMEMVEVRKEKEKKEEKEKERKDGAKKNGFLRMRAEVNLAVRLLTSFLQVYMTMISYLINIGIWRMIHGVNLLTMRVPNIITTARRASPNGNVQQSWICPSRPGRHP